MLQFIRRGRFRLYIVTAPGIVNIAFIHALILIYHKLDLFLDRRDFSVLILICNGEFYLSIIRGWGNSIDHRIHVSAFSGFDISHIALIFLDRISLKDRVHVIEHDFSGVVDGEHHV